jgi:hypothetical protein
LRKKDVAWCSRYYLDSEALNDEYVCSRCTGQRGPIPIA